MKTSTLKSAITIMTITTSLWSVLASAEDCDLKRDSVQKIQLAMINPTTTTKQEKSLSEEFNLTLVTPQNHPAYSAILDVYNTEKNTHVELWAIKQCLAVGPRHAVAVPGKNLTNNQIIGTQVEAYVGYKDSKTGFSAKRNLVPVICGKNNHSEGVSSEDICIYKSTENFPSTVQPIKLANFHAALIDQLGKNDQLEGVGFTDESIKLANNTFGLGRSVVETTSDFSNAKVVGANYIGNSGSGVLVNDQKNNAKYLAGFKVGQSNVVTGYQIMKLYSQLSSEITNCQ